MGVRSLALRKAPDPPPVVLSNRFSGLMQEEADVNHVDEVEGSTNLKASQPNESLLRGHISNVSHGDQQDLLRVIGKSTDEGRQC